MVALVIWFLILCVVVFVRLYMYAVDRWLEN